MDFASLTNSTSTFPILMESDVRFHLYFIFDRNLCSQIVETLIWVCTVYQGPIYARALGTYDPEHDRTNKVTGRQHPPSLISLRCALNR